MRSTCIICKKKREQRKMVHHGQHWMCVSCVNDRSLPGGDHSVDLVPGQSKIKVLNLYAGLGGNRYLWPGTLDITAVEINPKIAAEYKRNFPNDNVIIGDAHDYLLKHYKDFNIVWTSRPCQSHTKLNFTIAKKRYIDMGLYQEILFLEYFFEGLYVAENVRPYYEPLVPAQFTICRHLFWTNVPELTNVILPDFPPEFQGRFKGIMKMDTAALCSWLGVNQTEKTIYLESKCSQQVYRNCVHPLLGQSIMNDILNSMTGGRRELA